MRWQRSIRELLNRWSDQIDPYGHELRDLGPLVVPTISLGEDRVDPERPTWAGYPFSPAVAAQVSHVAVEAGTLPLELLSIVATVATADRIGLVTDQDLSTLFLGALTAPRAALVTDATNAPESLRAPVGGSGTRVMRGNAAWGSAAGLQVAALSPVELLARGPIVLPAGQRLAVAMQTANVGISAAFLWRELAG